MTVRVAVTGASGYIGPWLIAELVSRGHEVHAQDVVPPDSDFTGLRSFNQFNLGHDGARREWLWTVKPEVVIHLAALYGRVWGEKDLIKTAGVNAGLTAALARDVDAGGGRLMYMSSSEVYGDSANYGTVHPWTLLSPLNMYGLSKKWGEEAAEAYAPDGLMVTRLNMPYGPAYVSPAAGATHTSGRPGTLGYNVLHSMVWQAEHGLDLNVHKGTTRCLTWVGDTVRGLAVILESGESDTWNVNRNDRHIPVLELAERIVRLTGSKSRIVEVDPPERLTMRKSLDNTGLLRLGWAPTVELDEGIVKCWEYYRKFDADGAWRG